MDETGANAESGAEAITLPSGQSHWEVITDEFAAADVVVVLDTPNWRESPYCQDEYRFVGHWGKWVEFIDGTQSAELIAERATAIAALVAERSTVTGAHTRLVQSARARDAPPSGSRLDRMFGREGERDALAVLSADHRSTGLTITPQLAASAATTLQRANSAKQRVRRIATVAVCLLTVLATLGVIGMFFARSGERAAAAALNRAQSLDLADRSLREPDTIKALTLAREAGQQDSTQAATDALNISTANDIRMRTLILGPEEYYGANLAAHAPILLGSALDKLVVTDTETGLRQRSIDVPDSIQIGTVAVSADGTAAVFATRGSRTLRLINLTTGQAVTSGGSAVSAVTTSDGNDLWWSNDGGDLMRSTFSDLDSGVPPMRYQLPGAAIALSVSPERGLVDFIDGTGQLHTSMYSNDALTEVEVKQVTTPENMPSSAKQASATLKRCGDNLFGAIAGNGIRGTQFTQLNGVLETERMPMAQLAGVVCNPDGTAWYSRLVSERPQSFIEGTAHPILPLGSRRYVPALDPSGTRTAVLTNDGTFYELGTDRIRTWPAASSMSVMPLADADYLINDNGDVINSRTETVTGNVGPAFLQESVSTLARDALVATPTAMLIHIAADGATASAGPFSAENYSSLHPGSDGTQFVLTLHDRVSLRAATGEPATEIPVKDLGAGEYLADSDISPDGRTLGFVTNTGRVGMVSVEDNPDAVLAPEFAHLQVSSGTQGRVRFVPATGAFAVFSTDGVARLMDDSLETSSTAFYGVAPASLSANGSWLVASSSLGTTVYNGSDLSAVDRVTADQFEMTPETIRIDVANRELVGLRNYSGEDAKSSDRVRIPLPGMR